MQLFMSAGIKAKVINVLCGLYIEGPPNDAAQKLIGLATDARLGEQIWIV